jgi:hypothetical protein
MEKVESPNSRAVVEVSLDEIPSTSSVDSLVLHSHVEEVNPFHVIFNLNEGCITTCFDKGSHTIILHPRLKEFLRKCLAQFHVYIWSAT